MLPSLWITVACYLMFNCSWTIACVEISALKTIFRSPTPPLSNPLPSATRELCAGLVQSLVVGQCSPLPVAGCPPDWGFGTSPEDLKSAIVTMSLVFEIKALKRSTSTWSRPAVARDSPSTPKARRPNRSCLGKDNQRYRKRLRKTLETMNLTTPFKLTMFTKLVPERPSHKILSREHFWEQGHAFCGWLWGASFVTNCFGYLEALNRQTPLPLDL